MAVTSSHIRVTTSPKSKLTDKVVRELASPVHGHIRVHDRDLRGFGARVTATGTKSFILDYRIDGRERRYTIGQYPAWSVAAAREEAQKLRRRIDRGEDIMGERQAAREAPTVRDLAERYREEHLPKKRPGSRRDDESMLRRHVLPELGQLKVAHVEYQYIDRLHRTLKATPHHANRVVALLSKMFSLAERWGWRADNPCKGIERFPEQGRTRYLSREELARLTAALNAYPNQPAANVFRFLMLTGARKGEVLNATWDQFDLEQGVWTKPSAHTKQKREHRVPLNRPALTLLSSLPRTSVYVFPSRDGNRWIEIKKPWATICAAAGLEDLRIHDLRHSYASILASAGLSLPVIGQLLGHTQASTTMRYSHLIDDALRQATEHAGAFITAE
jgi:integrase